MSEEAKAVQELAKLGQRTLDSADKAGGWIADIFGEGIQNLAGTFADSAAGLRYRNRIRVLDKTQRAIEAAGLTGKLRPLPERIALPLLEAIAEECDETLQDVWATYIRNAANPEKPTADRVLIDVVRRLEPEDWPVLKLLFQSAAETLSFTEFGLDSESLEVILDRFVALGLLTFDDDTAVYLLTESSNNAPKLKVQGSAGLFESTRLLRALEVATAG